MNQFYFEKHKTQCSWYNKLYERILYWET